MATRRKPGETWQVQVRRQGHPAVSKSFVTRRDGRAWAREMERAMERGGTLEPRRSRIDMPLGDLPGRYLPGVTPRTRSAEIEAWRIGMIRRHPLARLRVAELAAAGHSRFSAGGLFQTVAANRVVRAEMGGTGGPPRG
jgi:hypothetical protein